MRSHLKVYFDFEAKTTEYSDEEKGRLLLAMLRYAKDGTEGTLTGNERFVFPVFKAQIDEDIRTYDIKVANGSRGGRPVTNMEPEETEENRNKPEITETNRSEPEESEIRKKEERRKKKEEQDHLFAQFWAAYPRKASKVRAKKEFEKLNPDAEMLVTFLTAIAKWKESDQWQEDGGRFIPYPATWLNQRRWEDEPPKKGKAPVSEKPVVAQQYEQRSYAEEPETPDEIMARLLKENV